MLKNKFSRFLFISLGVLLSGFVALQASPAKAAGSVIPTSDVRLEMIAQKATNTGGSTAAYVPHQFLLISDTPSVTFSVTGSTDKNLADIKLEVYQLANMTPGVSGPPVVLAPPSGAQSFSVSGQPARKFSGISGRYTGRYVFLLKVVHSLDSNHGYVEFDGINQTDGCPKSPRGFIECQNILRSYPTALPGDILARYMYHVQATGSTFITSAPSPVAFGIRWTGQTVDYEDAHGGQPYNLRFMNSNQPTQCRNGRIIKNADWDYPEDLGDPGVGDGEQENTPGWQDTDDKLIDAKVNGQTVRPIAISRGWRDGIWDFPVPPMSANDQELGTLDILNWNHNNILYLGGAEFTSGPLPACLPFGQPPAETACETPIQPGVQPLTPKPRGVHPFGLGCYDYNGRGEVDNYMVGQLMDFYTKFSSPGGYEYIQFEMDLDGKPLLRSSEVPGNQNGWVRSNLPPQGVEADPATPGPHTFTSCSRELKPHIHTGIAGEPDEPHYHFNDGAYVGGSRCSTVTFYVNAPPTSLNSAPSNNSQHNFTCDIPMSASATDPEGHPYQAKFFLEWNGANGSGNEESELSPPTPSGSSVTSDDVTIGGDKLSDFVRDEIPEGSTVSWYIKSQDAHITSDINPTTAVEVLASGLDTPGKADYGVPPSQQMTTTFKWGLESSPTSFYKKKRPVLSENETTKEFLDTNGTVIKSATDGQTLQVRITMKNTGETPVRRYKVIDHLGLVRDVEEPKDFRGGSGKTKKVTIDGKETWETTISGTEIAAGATKQVSYSFRANRNMEFGDRPDQRGDYSQKIVIGEGDSVADTKIEYQEDYCGSSLSEDFDKAFDDPTSVLAPFVRGGRGSAHSNGNIFGYDNSNATFTVTAKGNLSHFKSLNGETFENYRGAETGSQCSTIQSGAVDWRREMLKKITSLKRAPRNQVGPPFTRSATHNFNASTFDFNRSFSKVWEYNGNLNLSGPDKSFRGTGTIIVNGDLQINTNMRYAADSTVHSVGFIVLGNVIINPSVTQVVGSYYVSDMEDWTAAGPPLVPGTSDCPRVVTRERSGVRGEQDGSTNGGRAERGLISTGYTADQLNADGLWVAREFNLQRYSVRDNSRISGSENVYYDGRVISSTPPGFGTFNEVKWYEVVPR